MYGISVYNTDKDIHAEYTEVLVLYEKKRLGISNITV